MKVEEASEEADEDEDDPLTMLVRKVTAPKPESAAVGMEDEPKPNLESAGGRPQGANQTSEGAKRQWSELRVRLCRP